MSRIILTLLLTSMYTVLTIGQNSTIDSLKVIASLETDPDEKIKHYFTISNEYYKKQLRYDSAFVYLNKIIDIAHGEGLKEAEIVALNNLALIYETLGDKEKAISYYFKGLRISKELNMYLRNILLYNNIGLLYKDLEEYEKALIYLDSALTIAKHERSRLFIGAVNTSIGETKYAIRNYKEASHYLKIGISILDSLNQPFGESSLVLANSYRAEKKLDSAIIEAHRAFEESQVQKAPKSAYESSVLLSSIYADIGDSENEVMYLKIALNYNDSLSSRANLSNIELKELKKQQKDQDLQLQSLKNKESLYNNIYIIIGIVILLILGVILFKVRKNIRLTKDIHNAQRNLIQSELEKRKKSKNSKNS